MSEFAIQLFFDRRPDGRFHVHSPDVPGLHLAGDDLAVIEADIDPIVKDLLFLNSNLIVEKLHWVPSIKDVIRQMDEPAERRSKFLVIEGRAA